MNLPPFRAISALVLLACSAPAAPRPPWTANRVVGSPNPPEPYTVRRLFPTLMIEHPVDFAFMPGSDRLCVAEQNGRLWLFDTRRAAAQPELVLDLRPHHRPLDNVLGFTFHPGFATNRYVFINYNEPGGRTNGASVSRFTFSDQETPTIDPSSETVFLRWLSGGHNGCTLAFGNDGFLYISTGDAANPDPPDSPYKTGQDISDLLASILRIDVDHAEGTNAYAIPHDNPFARTPGARPEVWAFGLRNPFRMSFDRPTGDLWVGDVGWEQWEMVYRVHRGGNYGWSLTEGPNTHVRTDVRPGPGPIQPPLIAVPHQEGASITGGRVYHGKKLAGLRGAYVYGDWETGKFWALRQADDKLLRNDELCQTTLKPVAFAEDRDGELLILDYNGGCYEFGPNTAPPANLAFPRRLSETGLFAELPTLTPAAGVVPYRVNAAMWRDYASTERVLGVPGDGAVATSGGRETIAGRMWFFPSNTVFARTLSLEKQPGQPSSRRRVETQLLHFDGRAWNPYTFRWNAAQTDADLVPANGTNDVFTVTDSAAPGGRREIPWRFAGRAECLRCHNAWAGETLSFNWLQLSSPALPSTLATPGPGAGLSEMQRLEELAVLRVKDPPKPLFQLANPYDLRLPLAERARSWLHVNCAGCHRFGAGGGVPAQLNYELSLEQTRTLDVKPTRGDFGILGARVIAPGDPYRSVLFYRISTEGSGRMPHLGSRLADEAGLQLLRDWIRSLPSGPDHDPDVAAARRLATQNSTLLSRCRGETGRDAMPNLLAGMSGCLTVLGEVTDPALRAEFARAAAAHTNLLVRDLFQRLLPPEQRRRTLGTDLSPQTILARAGDAARGEELFLGAAQCARCHTCAGAGRAFGPDLTGLARKYSRVQLLEQILDPSKVIAPEYKTTMVTLRDDTELTGFVLRRTATEIVLRDESLTEHHVPLAKVRETRESTFSSMPEGLLAPMTAQEAADLLEFLAVSKPSPP